MSATYDRVAHKVLGSRRRCLTRMRDAEWRNVQANTELIFDTAVMLFNAAYDIIKNKENNHG